MSMDKVTIELSWQEVDRIIVKHLEQQLDVFLEERDNRHQGVGLPMFYTDPEEDVAELQKHIDAFKLVIEYFSPMD